MSKPITKNKTVRSKGTVTHREVFVLRKRALSHELSARWNKTISSVSELRHSLGQNTKNAFWISFDKDLTAALLKHVSWRHAPIGEAVLLHEMEPESIPALGACFSHVAFSMNGNFLDPEELAEALHADHRADLFIGGSVDRRAQTLTLWRGNLEPLTVPFSAFPESGDGTLPNFDRFGVADYGQTIKLGDYEAAAEAVLYEFDPAYRRRIKKLRQESEQSFGASLRRLRKQRGLSREDFAPDVAAKTVARIENSEVRRVQANTLRALAKRLNVAPEEIETF